jgi:hypothetical protein
MPPVPLQEVLDEVARLAQRTLEAEEQTRAARDRMPGWPWFRPTRIDRWPARWGWLAHARDCLPQLSAISHARFGWTRARWRARAADVKVRAARAWRFLYRGLSWLGGRR